MCGRGTSEGIEQDERVEVGAQAEKRERRWREPAGRSKADSALLRGVGKERTNVQTCGSIKSISPSFKIPLRPPSLIPF